MDYSAASEFLQRRLSLPTELSSKGISENLPPAIRAQCFLAARVAEARVLEKLRQGSDRYSAGELGFSETRKLLAQYLDAEGIGDPTSARMSNIASSMRLDLILRQNAAMAAAVGRYQVSRDPDIEERWPCWRYITGPNSRETHGALNGKVIPKKDPFWHSHYPPWDFNCNCDVEDSDEKPDKTPPYDEIPPESGFQFDPAHAFEEFDLGGLKPMSRQKIIEQAEEAVKDQRLSKCGFIAAPMTEGEKTVALPGIDGVKSGFKAMREAAENELKAIGLEPDHLPEDYNKINDAFMLYGKQGKNIPKNVLDKFQKEPLTVCFLNQRAQQAANLPPATPVILERGNSRRGIAHLWRHHKDLFVNPDESVRLLQETLGDPNCRVVVSLERVTEKRPSHGSSSLHNISLKRIVLHNSKSKTYCVMNYVQGKLKLVSWNKANDDYGEIQWALKQNEEF